MRLGPRQISSFASRYAMLLSSRSRTTPAQIRSQSLKRCRIQARFGRSGADADRNWAQAWGTLDQLGPESNVRRFRPSLDRPRRAWARDRPNFGDVDQTKHALGLVSTNAVSESTESSPNLALIRQHMPPPNSGKIGPQSTRTGAMPTGVGPKSTKSGPNSAGPPMEAER